MTPMDTLSALCRFLESTLRDFRFEDENKRERSITVYAFHLPDPPPSQMSPRPDDSVTPPPDAQSGYESMMPAVVVRPLKFEDKVLEDDFSIITLLITVGIFSRDPQNVAGPWGVVNILERIRQALAASPILENRCEILEPLSWELYDEALKPLWFGEMQTQWRLAVPQKLDDEDWMGNFLERREDKYGENENG